MFAGPHAILWPAFALVALTLVVWVRMYYVRIGEMRRLHIDPQSVSTSADAAARYVDTRASDNLRNLFELPVLFYAGVLVAHAIGATSDALLAVAWLFVALRVVHSFVHCGYNKVLHRFGAYVAGAIALWAMWGMLALALVRAD
ncbi:MAPEG family protein [Dokdonella sp.]|uniref:MAPEG family protein n=1 Tax=Dokdonella sp. TaxID=2291710 RepID=UPI002F41C2F5